MTHDSVTVAQPLQPVNEARSESSKAADAAENTSGHLLPGARESTAGTTTEDEDSRAQLDQWDQVCPWTRYESDR